MPKRLKHPQHVSEDQQKCFWFCVRALRAAMPAPEGKKVIIRFCNTGNDYGDLVKRPKTNVIRITEDEKCNACLLDTLAHEWAHLFVPNKLDDEAWGVWYSRTYKVVEESIEKFFDYD